MDETSNTASRTVAGLAKAGSGLLKLVGVLLLVYVVGVAFYGIVQYSTTKSKLLTYGLSDATGSLIAWAVMLIAFGAPAYAIFRIIMLRGKPYDYVAAMTLPLISWGIAMIPANFDAKTGEALKYCAKRPGGELFCLDRPGIDPITQQRLVQIDAKLAERQFREGRGLVPKRITDPLDKIQFFDPLSDASKPEPKVWVAKNEQGCYDLYDNPGVHPQTGEPLRPVTKETVRAIQECLVTSRYGKPTKNLILGKWVNVLAAHETRVPVWYLPEKCCIVFRNTLRGGEVDYFAVGPEGFSERFITIDGMQVPVNNNITGKIIHILDAKPSVGGPDKIIFTE